MTEKKQKPSRRVSFATEPQINYINHEEYNSSKTSSSINENPMDITTDLEELRDIGLFGLRKRNSLAQDMSEDEDELQIRNSFSRRCSLDPLKMLVDQDLEEERVAKSELEERQIIGETENNLAMNEENRDNFIANKDNSTIKEGNGCNLVTEEENKKKCAAKEDSKENSINEDDSKFQENSVNYGGDGESKRLLYENVASNSRLSFKRASLGPGLNDTGIMNSSFTVEELVNTIDLRKIIPQPPKEDAEIGEFLSRNGIRFLDEAVIDTMKRDTLSKSRNTVDPSMLTYYKYSLKERIDFLYNFSSFLIDKMRDLQREIENAERQIDVSSINKDNLKKIRNESRNKSKIDWYGLRKIYEIQFNKKMLENRSKVEEYLNSTRKENRLLANEIADRNSNVAQLNAKLLHIKKTIGESDQGKVQETEKLQKMINDRRKVLDGAREDLAIVSAAYKDYETDIQSRNKRIERLLYEIDYLKKNLSIKNINESQLDEIKNRIRRYKTMFSFRLIKLGQYNAIFELYGNNLSVEFTGDSNWDSIVSKYSIVLKEPDPFYEIAKVLPESGTLKFSDLVDVFSKRFSLAHSIKKEVLLLKEKIKTESFSLNEILYLRFHLDASNIILDLNINSSFDLVLNENMLVNLYSSPGSLSEYVHNRVNK